MIILNLHSIVKVEAGGERDEDSETREPFKPNRFPSFFKLRTESTEEKPAARIPASYVARHISWLCGHVSYVA